MPGTRPQQGHGRLLLGPFVQLLFQGRDLSDQEIQLVEQPRDASFEDLFHVQRFQPDHAAARPDALVRTMQCLGMQQGSNLNLGPRSLADQLSAFVDQSAPLRHLRRRQMHFGHLIEVAEDAEFLGVDSIVLAAGAKQPGNLARIRHGEFGRVWPHQSRDPLGHRPDFEDHLASSAQGLEHFPKALGGRLDFLRAMRAAFAALVRIEHVKDT
jgi:hypothetical protein